MDHGNTKIAQHALKVGLQNVEFGHNTEKEGYVWLWCLSCPKSVTKVEIYLQWPDMINFHMPFFAYVGEKRKTKRMCLPSVTKRFPFICEEKRIMHIPIVTTILTGVEGEVIAQLVERPTEKPDAILTQVWDHGVASFFSSPNQLLLWCLYNPCVQSHASTSVHVLKIPNTAGHAVWTHKNTAR